ncbi:probable CCR4-associated factor 1 homolog 11 [Oryza brachyantha]|uniref:probable CCR4-associated factor 1 homolog 11 n=1 Tax=Oryza brachyantha TaxID=4533 RepID=UPI001ADCB677|nr:probable CCR4-associated factor 1 homolog 11 [Oryza brachyantha]
MSSSSSAFPATMPAPAMNGAGVRSVWDDNFKVVSDIVRSVARRARHVALTVQYPGCPFVVQNAGERKPYEKLTAEERYQEVRANVDALRPIQVGLAIRAGDGDGEPLVFEFNLKGFNVNNPADLRDPNSIEYLQARGVDFGRLPRDGIESCRLRWLLWDSGLIRARPSWATFAGGYHVAYAVVILTGSKLPDSLDGFTKRVASVFGRGVYDVKKISREHHPGHTGALTKLAERLGIVPAEQVHGVVAGAGAALTLRVFETLKETVEASCLQRQSLQLCGLYFR